MIHVQSNLNENDDEQLNDEQIETNKKSVQLLNDQDQYRPTSASTPVYGDRDAHDKVANVDI
jgi:hypothetical protein